MKGTLLAQLTLDLFQLVLILCSGTGTIWNRLYGGCLVGMFLDLVSVGHINMSHAKICPGTPPLVNISFNLPTYRNHPVSPGRMSGRHGMMPRYWPRGTSESGIIVPGAGHRALAGHVTRGSCHYLSLSCDETVALVRLPDMLIISHHKTLPLSHYHVWHMILLYAWHSPQHKIRQIENISRPVSRLLVWREPSPCSHKVSAADSIRDQEGFAAQTRDFFHGEEGRSGWKIWTQLYPELASRWGQKLFGGKILHPVKYEHFASLTSQGVKSGHSCDAVDDNGHWPAAHHTPP